MDVDQALKVPLEDEGWVSKVLIGGALTWSRSRCRFGLAHGPGALHGDRTGGVPLCLGHPTLNRTKPRKLYRKLDCNVRPFSTVGLIGAIPFLGFFLAVFAGFYTILVGAVLFGETYTRAASTLEQV
ncbi:MAG: hypothetical protein QMC81_10525 [Thermoanaerobacterales bacterium]|nr:hypothetical protein [Bacillota bacterium]MDI6907900.1 hypothetical protein [Thermoanaerobacterales bacterium]